MNEIPENIEEDIRKLQNAHDADKLCQPKINELTRKKRMFDKLKGKIDGKVQRIGDTPMASSWVSYEELRIHHKSSIYYDPVDNPWGAPPNGQPIMYKHPDGSVKREPPEVAVSDPICGIGETRVEDFSIKHKAADAESDDDDDSDDDEDDDE